MIRTDIVKVFLRSKDSYGHLEINYRRVNNMSAQYLNLKLTSALRKSEHFIISIKGIDALIGLLQEVKESLDDQN